MQVLGDNFRSNPITPIISTAGLQTRGSVLTPPFPDRSSSEQIERSPSFHQRFGLFLARSCTAAWIGAASLFVVVGVMEVTRGGFDSTTKDLLVAIRFPSYYTFGTVLVSLAIIGTWFAGNTPPLSRTRRTASMGLLIGALGLMAADYVWIYSPLLQMVTPPGRGRPSGFAQYHEASKWINFAGLFLCCVPAWLLNWPLARSHALDSTAPADPSP